VRLPFVHGCLKQQKTYHGARRSMPAARCAMTDGTDAPPAMIVEYGAVVNHRREAAPSIATAYALPRGV
jgi:hypothetical protein